MAARAAEMGQALIDHLERIPLLLNPPTHPPTHPPTYLSIDTEGSFMAARAAEMGQALIDHLERILSSTTRKAKEKGEEESALLKQQIADVEVGRVGGWVDGWVGG